MCPALRRNTAACGRDSYLSTRAVAACVNAHAGDRETTVASPPRSIRRRRRTRSDARGYTRSTARSKRPEREPTTTSSWAPESSCVKSSDSDAPHRWQDEPHERRARYGGANRCEASGPNGGGSTEMNHPTRASVIALIDDVLETLASPPRGRMDGAKPSARCANSPTATRTPQRSAGGPARRRTSFPFARPRRCGDRTKKLPR